MSTAAPNPLRVAYARSHPAELAALLAGASHDDLLQALHGLPAEVGAGVIARLPHPLAVRLLASRDDATVTAWLSRAALDDALTLTLHLEQSRRGRILAGLPIRHMRRTLEQLVVYPQRTVGAVLDPTAPRLPVTTPLRDAVALLRADDYASLERVWLVDGDSRYAGMLDLSRALLATSDAVPVGELGVALAPLRAETALVAARDLPDWLHQPVLPVVDHLGHLLGALSRSRLQEALTAATPARAGVGDAVGAVAGQYLRFLGECLGDLLGRRPRPPDPP
jgi:Mg/Co/Ni transporter MgtE